MSCPFCSSEHVIPKSTLHGETRFHCNLCGEDFMVDMDENPGEDDDPTLALCDAYGHDWQHVNGYTVAFSVCSRCGIVTNH